jgi:uncharacterized protein (TIGR02246 family)
MSRTAYLLTLLLALGTASHALVDGTAAQPASDDAAKSGGETSDVAAIRAGAEAFVTAFNAADAKAIAALWIEKGEYIDHTGQPFIGRDAIEKGYAEFFAENPNIKMQLNIDAVRMLSNETAIERGSAVAVAVDDRADGFTQYTVVHVKVNGQWKMASVQDAFVQPPPSASSAADLAWLVGTWEAEEHGVKTVSVCRWVADGRFLERSYRATNIDGTSSSGVELVGWNPSAGHVQSWSFSPDGGNAVGFWFPQQDGWRAQMRGIDGDGAPLSSVNQLRKLDDNAYVWQSIERSVGGMLLPDTHEVVWKRQANQSNDAN